MINSKSVALYARVSSQRQANELTIESQIDAIRQRIEQDGFRIDDESCFLDQGYGGGTLVRPSLERLRDAAWAGAIDRLYVHSADRLSRKYAYQMLLLEELQKHNVETVFLNHDPQDQSPEGSLLLQVQGMIAEYERAKILERTRRGRRFAARQGQVSVMAHAPYGYRYITKQEGGGEAHYEVHPEEASLVRRMFGWVAVEGLSLADVVRRLAEMEIPTRTGKARWDRTTVRGILRNPAYKGVAVYGKTKLMPRKSASRPGRGSPATPRREKTGRPTAPNEQEHISVPAILGEDLFDVVATRLEDNQKRYRQQRGGATHLLSGLIVCQCCGSAYCGRRHRRSASHEPRVYYRCIGTDKFRHGGEAICKNKSLHGKRVEAAVWNNLRDLLHDPRNLQREFERRLGAASNQDESRNHHAQAATKLKRRIARLIDGYENEWIDKNDFETRMRRAKEQLERHQSRLNEYDQTESCQREYQLALRQFEDFAEQVASGLDEADFETKRTLVRLLIARIEVDEEEIRIVYKIRPPSSVAALDNTKLQDCLERQ